MVLRRHRTHHSEGPDAHQPRVEAQPETYERWRRTTLGSATQIRELEVVFDLAGPLRNQRLLDVGCGDGIYLVEAARCGAVASGVDISEAMLIVARRRAADAGVTVDLGFAGAQALPFDDDSFDVVFGITVLCFVPDPQTAVAEMSRVLAPGGRLVIGELGRWNTWARGGGSAAGWGRRPGGMPTFTPLASSPTSSSVLVFNPNRLVVPSTTRPFLSSPAQPHRSKTA